MQSGCGEAVSIDGPADGKFQSACASKANKQPATRRDALKTLAAIELSRRWNERCSVDGNWRQQVATVTNRQVPSALETPGLTSLATANARKKFANGSPRYVNVSLDKNRLRTLPSAVRSQHIATSSMQDAIPRELQTPVRPTSSLSREALGLSPPTKKRQRPNMEPLASRRRRVYPSDRFIPLRSAMDLDYCHFAVTEEDAENPLGPQRPKVMASATVNSTNIAIYSQTEVDQRARNYQEALAANLLPSPSSPSMACTSPASSSKRMLLPCRRDGWTAGRTASHLQPRSLFQLAKGGAAPLEDDHSPTTMRLNRRRRLIPTTPSKILDAPELRDDYYLNLVSWGSNNLLAVALGQVVYLYNPESGAIHEIRACSSPTDYVTSVAWISGSGASSGGSSVANRDQLAIGTFLADLQVWDAVAITKVRSLRGGHRERIGSLAWNGPTLTSGSRDAKILHHDLRAFTSTTSTALVGHQQEICGLAWSPDGLTLASGGNDNCLCLWDARRLFRGSNTVATWPNAASRGLTSASMPRDKLCAHQAAVKALAWCPWERHLLASGGGTADRTIKFWNGATSKLLRSVPTGSQVCALVWATHERELLSSHGFSHNELCLWQYPTMTRLREFTGHTARVLHLAMSPDGRSVVSAAADETLRFWDVFSSSTRGSAVVNKGAASVVANMVSGGAVIR